MNFGQKESFQRWKEFANRQLHSITLSRERYRRTRSYWHLRLHFNSQFPPRETLYLSHHFRKSVKKIDACHKLKKNLLTRWGREKRYSISRRERERCVIGIHNWNDVGAILIQKVSSKKQEASIEGSSVYKAEEDGGSVFWKRGNASIAGLSRRPTRVRQVFRRLPNEERERERDLLCKCPICTGCVVRPRFSYSEPSLNRVSHVSCLNFHFQSYLSKNFSNNCPNDIQRNVSLPIQLIRSPLFLQAV